MTKRSQKNYNKHVKYAADCILDKSNNNIAPIKADIKRIMRSYEKAKEKKNYRKMDSCYFELKQMAFNFSSEINYERLNRKIYGYVNNGLGNSKTGLYKACMHRYSANGEKSTTWEWFRKQSGFTFLMLDAIEYIYNSMR